MTLATTKSHNRAREKEKTTEKWGNKNYVMMECHLHYVTERDSVIWMHLSSFTVNAIVRVLAPCVLCRFSFRNF